MTRARLALFGGLLALAACSKPSAPKVTPISGRVTSTSASGINVEAKLEADNKNDIDLDIESFTAKLKLDNAVDVGPVTAPHAIHLPAHKKVQFDLPISFKWTEVLSLAPLALSNKDVPYEASGTVKVGAEGLEVEVPFKVTGVVTHAQMQAAVGKAIPKVPGLPGLPF